MIVLKRLNTILAISGAIPLFASLAFAMYMTGASYRLIIGFVIACALITILSILIVRHKIKTSPRINFSVTSISQTTSEIFGSFIAFVLPLIFAGMKYEMLPIIEFSCFIYLSLIIITNTVYPSWIFPLMGYRLYKIKTESNIEALLLSKRNVFNIVKNKIKVIELDNCCYLEVIQ